MAPDLGGEEPHRPPPHPLDRVWMHPSELGVRSRSTSRRIRRTVVMGITILTGAAALAVMAVVVGFVGGSGEPGGPGGLGGPGGPGGLDGEEPAAIGQHSADAIAATEVLAATDALGATIVVIGAAGPERLATGSGVSLGGGQVVTSAQVVRDAELVTVTTGTGTTGTGTTHEARVIGHDGESDLALLAVEADLPPAPLGRADLLAEDDRVIAIAAHGDTGHWIRTASLRERDALAETATGDVVSSGLLGTDAPTTPVHAGGALVDRDGMVVGILVAPPGTEVRGAAVPIEKVTGVCDQLRRTGSADHGWLGIGGTDVPGGVRVQAVVPGGPADRAGLRVGDTVLAVGHSPVEHVGGLAADIRAHRPGDEVKIRARQEGREQIFAVTLGTFGVGSAATP